MNKYQLSLFVYFLTGAAFSPAFSEEAGKLFQAKCASCHTVGKGQLVGPDLSNVKDWEVSKLSAAVNRMQSMAGPMSQEEVDSLTNYLKSSNPEAPPAASSAVSKDSISAVQNGSGAPVQKDASVPVGASQADVPAVASKDDMTDLAQKNGKEPSPGIAEDGEKYFTGEKAFSNGGLSCIACHSSKDSHGALGPSLDKIGDKMNEAALVTACRLTPYKVMKATYEKHPLTDQEAADVAKYLVSSESKNGRAESPFVPYGLAGAALVVLAVALGYHKRNSSVHSKLHRR